MRSRSIRPVIIDLFAGVGGMSLGAARAGFDVRQAVELDPIASASHAVNFPATRHLTWDVSAVTGKALLDAGGIRLGELDGLIGGPPCQGFSDMGKRVVQDERNSLFAHFFRLVAELRPRFFVAENVPGILAERNKKIVSKALSRVPRGYVLLEPGEISADRLGAPTTRSRVFFVGYDPERMEQVNRAALFGERRRRPVTVGEALLGLPRIRSDWQREEQGWREVKQLPEGNAFYERATNATPRGVGSPIALRRLRQFGEVSGNLGTRHSIEVVRRFDAVRPGQSDRVSGANRLAEDGFCPTLRAGTGPDRGSFQSLRPIHHKSPRVITPREAARLQGFPDWFQFHRTKHHSFRQIGNSVSPIVAEAVLSYIRSKL